MGIDDLSEVWNLPIAPQAGGQEQKSKVLGATGGSGDRTSLVKPEWPCSGARREERRGWAHDSEAGDLEVGSTQLHVPSIFQ